MTDLQTLLNRQRVIQSVRFTLVATATLIVAALVGVSTGILAVVPAITLVLFLKDETFAASSALLAGALFGTAYVLLISHFWAQVPGMFLVFSLIAIFAMSYWAAQGIRGRWSYIAFPLSGVLTVLSALFADMTGADNAVDVALVWAIEMPVGVVTLWIILIGLWPSPTGQDLGRLIGAARGECASLLRQTIAPVAQGLPETYAPGRIHLKFFDDLARTVNLNAGRLKTGPFSRDILISRLESLSLMYANIRYVQRSFENLPEPGLSTEARRAVTDIISALALRVDGRPGADTTAAIETIRREQQNYAADAKDDLTARRVAARLAGFTVAVDAVNQDIAAFDNPQPPQDEPSIPPERSALGFEIDSLQAAIKIVIGVLIGMLVFMATNLPASAYLVIIIIIVLVQPNLGRAHLRLRLWFPGVLFGSLWAMVGLLVLSLLPHFGIYLAWLLPGLFLAGYLSMGPDRVAYVGIQIAASMATILGMTVFPVDNVASAEARIVGATVGFLIALSVYHFIWPLHPANLLRQNIVLNLRDLSNLISRIGQVEAEERDKKKEAQLAQEVTALKLRIQADFGLLYDISYMLGARTRPNYDYHALSHQVGLMYQQVWCLHQVLVAEQEVERRRRILAPILAAGKPLSAVFADLANRLDQRLGATAEDIQEPILAARDQARTFLDELASYADPRDQRDPEYGVNTVSIMLYHLNLFADAMNTERGAQPVRTAELAHLYEAVDQ